MENTLVTTATVKAAPVIIEATVVDYGMAFLLLAAFITGASKMMDGLKNFREPDGKMDAVVGALIIVVPAVLFAVFIQMYPGMSDLISDPSQIDLNGLDLD